MEIGFLGIIETYIDFSQMLSYYGAIMNMDLARFAFWLYKSIENDIKSIIDTTQWYHVIKFRKIRPFI